ncbi:hypothetical protein DCS_02831 [Drechmeria coniospora]|uniref:HRQ family protein 2 n=1 Tax=Drechmeria coniospora TaxID=98403 RepID=A0A151GX60_DRECN|nr:hypothetical protein DCS_02831 [Drechmeria coniospora]KYK61688.1 hypothetical protein DCS_02831 [Drechmeria coniospora]
MTLLCRLGLGSVEIVALVVLLLSLAVLHAKVGLLPVSPRPGRHQQGAQPAKAPAVGLVIEPLTEFDWKRTEPRRLRPFKNIYHVTMALQSDSPSNLITVDKDYLDRVHLRRSLIGQHGEKVHGCLPGGVEAVRELYIYLLRRFLPARYPTMFALSRDERQLSNLVTGKTFPVSPPEDPNDALRVLGETVEEDMFLLHNTPEGHKSFAFLCCFPAGFDPSTKLGKLLRDIHSPVPSYDKIGASMERFFAKLEVGKPVKRANASAPLVPTVRSVLTGYRRDPAAMDAADIDIDHVFFRVELQTLTRLPQTRALLFSFKTYMYPLRQIKEEGLGPDLAAAVEGLKNGNAPAMWTYKGGHRWSRRVCEYLRA